MIYLWYALLNIINLAATLLAYPLAPLVAPFTRSTGYLPNCLTWFQTFDAPLDAGWRDGYFKTVFGWLDRYIHIPVTAAIPPTGFALYWLRVRWLWRNPVYGLCYWLLGVDFKAADWTVLRDVSVGGESLFLAVAKTGHFCLMYGGSLGELKLGWKASHMWVNGAWSTTPWGPVMRVPFAFTPKCWQPWKIPGIFRQPVVQGTN